MKVIMPGHDHELVKIEKESTDKRIGKTSTFFCHIKRDLQLQGYDVICKDAGKDGNLTSEGNFYVRTRKRETLETFCVHDGMYAIRDIAKDFNALKPGEHIELSFMTPF